MGRKFSNLIVILLLAGLLLCGCGSAVPDATDNVDMTQTIAEEKPEEAVEVAADEAVNDAATETVAETSPTTELADIPDYDGELCIELLDNVPDFTEDEKQSTEAFENYSELDSLGRCGVAFANICTELMPTEERGEIGQIKPTGWVQAKYEGVVNSSPPYLYNRCHLIGYQLAGENANEKNLITGTRYLNIEGMLSFENQVADYVKSTDNHVLYRVTPFFEDDNLLATGVQMEAWSVEDEGDGVCFNVFVYNVQPGVIIDYATGESQLDENYTAQVRETEDNSTEETVEPSEEAQDYDYVLNTNTKKFHYPDCSSVSDMKDSNKEYFSGTRDEAIEKGYSPCGRCQP